MKLTINDLQDLLEQDISLLDFKKKLGQIKCIGAINIVIDPITNSITIPSDWKEYLVIETESGDGDLTSTVLNAYIETV